MSRPARRSTPRSRAGAKKGAAKTHCLKGHEYTPDNTMVGKEGWRQCRACSKASHAAWYKKNREEHNRRRREKRLKRPPMKKAERKLTIRTHCPQGHEYNDENTLWTKRGSRFCRTCHRAAGTRWYRQNRTECIRRSRERRL